MRSLGVMFALRNQSTHGAIARRLQPLAIDRGRRLNQYRPRYIGASLGPNVCWTATHWVKHVSFESIHSATWPPMTLHAMKVLLGIAHLHSLSTGHAGLGRRNRVSSVPTRARRAASRRTRRASSAQSIAKPTAAAIARSSMVRLMICLIRIAQLPRMTPHALRVAAACQIGSACASFANPKTACRVRLGRPEQALDDQGCGTGDEEADHIMLDGQAPLERRNAMAVSHATIVAMPIPIEATLISEGPNERVATSSAVQDVSAG